MEPKSANPELARTESRISRASIIWIVILCMIPVSALTQYWMRVQEQERQISMLMPGVRQVSETPSEGVVGLLLLVSVIGPAVCAGILVGTKQGRQRADNLPIDWKWHVLVAVLTFLCLGGIVGFLCYGIAGVVSQHLAQRKRARELRVTQAVESSGLDQDAWMKQARAGCQDVDSQALVPEVHAAL